MAIGDIDPQSGCRLPFPKREDLSEEGKKIYDYHVDPKAGSLAGLKGPGGVRLHSPKLSEYLRPVGRYLRHEAGLDPKIREIAIMTTAREMNAPFEWAAHETEGRHVGVSETAIDVIKHRKPVDGLPEYGGGGHHARARGARPASRIVCRPTPGRSISSARASWSISCP